MGDAPGGPLPPHQWEALDGDFLEDGVGRDWMDALLEDEPLAPAPGAVTSGRRSPGVCFSSKERQVIAAPAPKAPQVAAADTEELRAEADALADCGAVALCAPLLALERADPATRAVALQLVRWFRARLSGVQVPPLTNACRGPPSVPSNRIGAADDMDLCARRPSADWGSATCYGRLEGSPSTRPAPLFNLAKATQAPRPTGYARLAHVGEHRRDVFESARADAAAQLVSSALRSCARLEAAAAETRLLLELCDDRGDGDAGPQAARKASHARCAYVANGAGARGLNKERWRRRSVATAQHTTLHEYAMKDESGLLKPACSPDLRDALLGLEARGVRLDDVCVCVEAPACGDPGASRFTKHLPWSPWSAAGHLSRVLAVFRESVLRVVEGEKGDEIKPAPPKRQRSKQKEEVVTPEKPPPQDHALATFTSFFGERCTVHAAPLRKVLGGWSCATFLAANLATLRREAVALAAQRARFVAAAREGPKPVLVEFDLPPRDFAYATDGGTVVADRYLLLYPKTDRSVFIMVLRRVPCT